MYTGFVFQVKCQPPPLSLYRQLVWREFFFTLASQNPNMDRAVDNPLSLNIPWEDNEKALDAWKKVSLLGWASSMSNFRLCFCVVRFSNFMKVSLFRASTRELQRKQQVDSKLIAYLISQRRELPKHNTEKCFVINLQLTCK